MRIIGSFNTTRRVIPGDNLPGFSAIMEALPVR